MFLSLCVRCLLSLHVVRPLPHRHVSMPWRSFAFSCVPFQWRASAMSRVCGGSPMEHERLMGLQHSIWWIQLHWQSAIGTVAVVRRECPSGFHTVKWSSRANSDAEMTALASVFKSDVQIRRSVIGTCVAFIMLCGAARWLRMLFTRFVWFLRLHHQGSPLASQTRSHTPQCPNKGQNVLRQQTCSALQEIAGDLKVKSQKTCRSPSEVQSIKTLRMEESWTTGQNIRSTWTIEERKCLRTFDLLFQAIQCKAFDLKWGTLADVQIDGSHLRNGEHLFETVDISQRVIVLMMTECHSFSPLSDFRLLNRVQDDIHSIITPAINCDSFPGLTGWQ